MTDRLPPLTALRAFDAAARHMSFAQAATELNVTPAALSFQIKSLEDHLGAPVFRRLNRAVALTEIGRALAPGTSEGFATLTAAWRNARRMVETQVLTVTAGPAFTAKWLAPRLYNFAQTHPDIELRLAATLRIMDFDRDQVDVAVRFGLPDDDGLYSRAVMREWVTPMASPALAGHLTTPEDLRGATLLHADDTAGFTPPFDWGAWFRAAGLGSPPKGGPRFSQADHALDAALAGGGVALGRATLAADALREGLLVAPFTVAISTPAQFRLLCPKGNETRPHVKAFLDWVARQIESTESLHQSFTMVPAESIAL